MIPLKVPTRDFNHNRPADRSARHQWREQHCQTTSDARNSSPNSHLCWCILGNRDWRDCKGPEGTQKENIMKQSGEKELEILGMEKERGGNGGAEEKMRKRQSCEHESKMCICNLSFAALLA